MKRIPVIFFLFYFLTIPAKAQITYDGCVDALGRPVASVGKYNIGDMAMAKIDPRTGKPIIEYDPNILSWVSPEFRLWVYAHECAHHALGHTIGSSYLLTAEQEADCWATKELFRAKLIVTSDLEIIQNDLSKLGQKDWRYLPGPIRAIKLEDCIPNYVKIWEEWVQCGGKCREWWEQCTDNCDSDSCAHKCGIKYRSCDSRCDQKYGY